jgi:hypothetical protein
MDLRHGKNKKHSYARFEKAKSLVESLEFRDNFILKSSQSTVP